MVLPVIVEKLILLVIMEDAMREDTINVLVLNV